MLKRLLLLPMFALLMLGLVSTAQAQSTWCYDFNFPVNGAEDWVTDVHGVQSGGEFTVGVGFTYTDNVDTAANPDIGWRGLYIRRTFSSTTLTRISMRYDYDKGSFDANLVAVLFQANGSNLRVVNYAAAPEGTDIFQEWTGTQAGINQLDVFIRTSRDTSIPYSYSGDTVVKAIRLEGTGTNPFGTGNCDLVADFSFDPTTGDAPLIVQFTDESIGEVTDYLWTFGDGTPESTDANPEHEFEEPGIYTVTLTVTGPLGTDSVSQLIVVTDNGGLGGEGWVRPLLQADEHADLPLYDFTDLWDIVDGNGGGIPDIDQLIAPAQLYRVYAASTTPGDVVMAVAGGEVVDIIYGAGTMCSIWGIILNAGCIFPGPSSSDIFRLYQFNIDPNVQLVTVELEDETQVRYMVYNANKYVKIGQVIEAGCVIGETIEANEPPISQAANLINDIVATIGGLGDLLSPGQAATFGIALIEHLDPSQPIPVIPLLPQLIAYNTNPEPCNLNPNFKDCLVSNPDFRWDAEGWTLFGDVDTSVGGVLLAPNAYIQQIVNLPEATTFTFRLGVYYDILDLLGGRTGEERQLLIRVGTFSVTETIEVTSEYQEITVEVPEPGISPGELGYIVRIQNVSDEGGILIQGACLSTNDRELNPRNCYFQNYEFDGITGWAAPSALVGAGYLQIADLETISQEITLLPNEDESPRTYRLEVDARVIPVPGATYDSNSGSAGLAYGFGEDTDNIGSLDLQWNTPGNPGYPDAYQTISVDFEVSEPTTAAFTIIGLVSGNSTILGVAVDRACILAEAEGPPTSGVSGPFQTTCNTIPIPTDETVGAWTMYHWRNLDKFFNCKLMVLLNKWFKVFDEFKRTSLLFMRYSVALVQRGANWLTTAMWWANGHFRNMAIGQVTTITTEGGCHDLFCAIVDVVTTLGNLLTPIIESLSNITNVLLGVLIGAVNLFFTLVSGLLAFVVALIIRLFNFLQLATGLLGSIITAWNTATPTAIPGLPTCTVDPNSSLLCIIAWILDNTILAGRWGVLITLILAILAIHMILWAIGEFRSVLLKTWSSS